MRKKIVGIFVCTLVLAATVLPVAGIMTISNNKNIEKTVNSDTTIIQNLDDSQNTNNPKENTPQPAATKTGYLSMPAAAFQPFSDSTDYTNYGTWIYGTDQFIAPVYLPHDAIVTRVTVYWRDVSASDLQFILIKYPLGSDTEINMAEGLSSGSSGEGTTVDDTIVDGKIDNIGHSYFFWVALMAGPNIKLRNVLIEYTYDTGGNSNYQDISQQTQPIQNILSR